MMNNGSRQKIFLVEDDPAIGTMIQNYLMGGIFSGGDVSRRRFRPFFF